MEDINNFNRGLHKSNSPYTQPENSYIDALNWVRNDEGRLTTEQKEEITFVKNETLVGHTILNGEAICFFSNSEIGSYNFLTKEYKTLYIDETLNLTNYVDATARVLFNNERVVYFVTSNNNPKYYNIDQNKLGNLFLDFKFPNVENISILEDGNLPSGVYQFAIRYVSNLENKTNFGLVTKVIPIVDDLIVEGRENYDGAFPQTPTSKSITFDVTNLDENYPYYEVVVITYLGLNSTVAAFSLGTFSSSNKKIYYSSSGQHVYQVDISEINSVNIPYTKAKHIKQKDNVLIISNLETEESIDFQEVANNIKIYVKPETIAFNEVLNINFPTVRGAAADSRTNDVSLNSTNTFFTDYKNELLEPGFQRDEIYSLFFIPIYKKGNIGNAFPIPAIPKFTDPITGLTTTDQYISKESYPNNYTDIGGQPIKHHKIPSLSEYPLITGDNITILKLKASNIILTDAQKEKIQGYIIGYQKRDSSLNMRVVTEGILRPYMWNGNKGFASAFNGSSSVQLDDEQTINLQETKPYYSFVSADNIHGVNIHGTHLEYSGFYEGPGNLISTQPGGSPIYASEFINAKNWVPRTSLPPARILDLQNIPLSGVNSNSVLSDGDVAIKIRGTKGFTHIKTENNLIGLSDLLYGSGFTFHTFYLNNTPKGYVTKNEQTSYLTEDDFNDNNLSRIYTARMLNINDNQYGKIENAEVYSLANTFDIHQTEIDFGGDTFVQKYAYYLNETFSINNLDDFTIPYLETKSLIYTFLESRNNFNYRHYDLNEVPYFPKYKKLYSTTEPIGLTNIFLEKGNSSGYNKQYSVTNNIRSFFPKPSVFQEVNSFPNRSIYSEIALEGDSVDQMRLFLPNSFHDIPKNKGEITDTFIFNNDFYHHTERGLWKSFFNSMVYTNSSEGNILLGNSGIFNRPSVEVLTLNGGYMGTTSKCGVNTPFGRIFLDNHQGKIFLLNETITEISDLGLFTDFMDFVNPFSDYTAVYDIPNKRYLLSNKINKAISYYPKTNTWVCYHDFAPEWYLSSDKYTDAFKDKSFYTLKNSENKTKESSITIIANNDLNIFKRFENCEIASMSGTDFSRNCFNSIQCWNETQNSSELPLILFDNYEEYSEYYNDLVPLQYFKGTYRLELPLNSVINAKENIFESSNIDLNKEFKENFTSLFLKIKLTYKNTATPLVLSYIKVNSKISDY